jgi:hypothetical protein
MGSLPKVVLGYRVDQRRAPDGDQVASNFGAYERELQGSVSGAKLQNKHNDLHR